MPQVHRESLVLGDTVFHLVRCPTREFGMSINTLFRIVASEILEIKGRAAFFPSGREYEMLIASLNQKKIPEGWKSYAGTITFPYTRDQYRYLKWYGKGRGRRWRPGVRARHDVMDAPACIMCAKL